MSDNKFIVLLSLGEAIIQTLEIVAHGDYNARDIVRVAHIALMLAEKNHPGFVDSLTSGSQEPSTQEPGDLASQLFKL